jgi:hypothetical protein
MVCQIDFTGKGGEFLGGGRISLTEEYSYDSINKFCDMRFKNYEFWI